MKPTIRLGDNFFSSSRIWEVVIKPPNVIDGGFAIEFSVFLGDQFFDGFAIPCHVRNRTFVALIVPEVEQKMSAKNINRYFKLLRSQIEELVKERFDQQVSILFLPNQRPI